jgi:hypothetical protein
MPFHRHLRIHPLWAPLAQSTASPVYWSPEPEDNNETSDNNDATQSSNTDDQPPIID